MHAPVAAGPRSELGFRASNNGFAAVFQTGVNDVDAVVRRHFVIGVREIDPPGGRDLPSTLDISFRLQGDPGSAVRIGNVPMPGLVQGDFSRGYLDGWTVAGAARRRR